jgi:hypothetical protein
MNYSRREVLLLGLLLFASGVGLGMAYFLIPNFLWGASLFGGIFGVFVPVGLIVLGILLVYGGITNKD